VSIQWKGSRKHFCGGSIIEPDIVVTAAHCLHGETSGGIEVRAGLLDLNNPPKYSQRRDVRKFDVHESHAGEANDIALLKLEAPFNFTESPGHIGAVCLPTSDRLLENVVVSGWGATMYGGPTTSHLLAVSLPVRSCNDEYRFDSNILFCAGSPGKDSCKGDSGGPAVQKESGSFVLVGVVSDGRVCGKFPGIYVRVSAYTAWISENILKLRS
ncbi:secreted serine protease, putative, partial [Ixodes scapularis]